LTDVYIVNGLYTVKIGGGNYSLSTTSLEVGLAGHVVHDLWYNKWTSRGINKT
jgi:hypothetical protein